MQMKAWIIWKFKEAREGDTASDIKRNSEATFFRVRNFSFIKSLLNGFFHFYDNQSALINFLKLFLTNCVNLISFRRHSLLHKWILICSWWSSECRNLILSCSFMSRHLLNDMKCDKNSQKILLNNNSDRERERRMKDRQTDDMEISFRMQITFYDSFRRWL